MSLRKPLIVAISAFAALGVYASEAETDKAEPLAAEVGTEFNEPVESASPNSQLLSNLWGNASRYERDADGRWVIVSPALEIVGQAHESAMLRRSRQAPGVWEMHDSRLYTSSGAPTPTRRGSPTAGASSAPRTTTGTTSSRGRAGGRQDRINP